MKINIYFLYTLLFVSFFSFAQSGTKNFIDQPYIEVTGQAEMEITPNEIYLRITLNENDKKGRISIEKQENQMLKKLRECDIDLDKQLTVEDFDGYYKRKFLGNNEVAKIKRYQLIVHDGKTLAKIYQELDEIDVSNISIIKVDHTEIESLKRQNKIKAIKEAKDRAKDYAIAIDQNIGNALYIQEVQQYNSYRYNSNTLDEVVVTGYSASENKEVITDLGFKPIIIKSSVITRFALK